MSDDLFEDDVNPSTFEKFYACGCAGDLKGMRALVAAGFNPAECDEFGEHVLETLIGRLELFPDTPKYEVVMEALRLGADARQKNGSCGPLFGAVLNMDKEMLRILLDAGVNPNTEKADSEAESFYDWAAFDYRYEIWNVNPPDETEDADRIDEDAWLRYLDRLAVKYGKRRPDHLQLLRARGALSMAEMREQKSQ